MAFGMDRKEFLLELRRLEKVIENIGRDNVNLQIERDQAIEAAQEIGTASMRVREEDVAQLADYKTTNTELIKFVEKVGNSKSKFAKEAKKLLGM